MQSCHSLRTILALRGLIHSLSLFIFPYNLNKNRESIALCTHLDLPRTFHAESRRKPTYLNGSTKTHNRDAFQPWHWTLTLAKHARRRDSYNDSLHFSFTTCGGPTRTIKNTLIWRILVVLIGSRFRRAHSLLFECPDISASKPGQDTLSLPPRRQQTGSSVRR